MIVNISQIYESIRSLNEQYNCYTEPINDNIWGQYPSGPNNKMNFRPFWTSNSKHLTDEEINKFCPWYWDYKCV